MNEEELKTNVLDPWLRSVKLTERDVSREYSFPLQLGRSKVRAGRCDVLVSVNATPVFVVEAKEPEHAITERDRRQVLSYARLLLPRAVWAVVTNGRNTEILHPISGAPASAAVRKDLAAMSPPDVSGFDIALRFSALKYFLALTPDNLAAFSRAQVAYHTRKYRDTNGPFFYSADTYVERETLLKSIRDFFGGDGTALVLEGVSGVGKTAALIHMCEALVPQGRCLYIPLGSVGGSVLEFLAREFSVGFSEERSPTKVMADLEEICGTSTPLVLAVDETDEFPLESLVRELDDLARVAERRPGWLRIVVVATPDVWASLKNHRGYQTNFALSVEDRVVALECFTEQELRLAVGQLEARLGVRGLVPPGTAEFARNPSMLRIMVALAQERQGAAGLSLSDALSRYLAWAIKRSGDAQGVKRLLRGLAVLIASQCGSQSQVSEIDEDTLIQQSSPSDNALTVAARRGFLRKRDDGLRTYWSFCDRWLQEYLIAAEIMGLGQAGAARSSSVASRWYGNAAIESAAMWCAWVAPEESREILRALIRVSAERFVDACRRIRGCVPGIREAVRDQLILAGPPGAWMNFGFSPIAAEDGQPLVWDEAEVSERSLREVVDAYGCKSLHATRNAFVGRTGNADVAEVVIRKFEEMVTKSCPTEWFLSDTVSGEIVGAFMADGRFSCAPPAADGKYELAAVAHALDQFYAERIAEAEYVESHGTRMADGGCCLSGGCDRNWIVSRAKEIVATSKRLRPTSDVRGDTLPAAALEQAIAALEARGARGASIPASSRLLAEMAFKQTACLADEAVEAIQECVVLSLATYRKAVADYMPGLVGSGKFCRSNSSKSCRSSSPGESPETVAAETPERPRRGKG